MNDFLIEVDGRWVAEGHCKESLALQLGCYMGHLASNAFETRSISIVVIDRDTDLQQGFCRTVPGLAGQWQPKVPNFSQQAKAVVTIATSK